ncbi:hypothetical protein PSECIP111854_02783 [Pseudoalteromonas sp. CIP111854]|uniref:DUF1513 domain-containing protein n=1 Tax=Pseudoalteromonas holothuriae TaxID=2963714 RepID=A0A9W4R0E6_9GAMM|nr:DUF1513 domain-containing protein [Pseudoalteromonas sp. CIP111854]CAH9061309.1 hypothetical protein PSECIP111854_02783 [Pseudoalteromonas sp. CIP111854]
MLVKTSAVRLSRRDFCKGLFAIGASVCITPFFTSCSVISKQHFASAYTDKQGNHHVAWFNQNGDILGQVNLQVRAHDLCYVPRNNILLAFSRRPGRILYVIDLDTQTIINRVNSAKSQHFFGHGALSKDGKWLYTTENRYDDSYRAHEGIIVVRNTNSFSTEAQFSSGGIGPHQLAMLAHEDTLVVANGGIHTHPAKARAKLNLDVMQPNLSYINMLTGKVVEQVKPPDHQLSTRHLCLASDDTVYVGCQYQGPAHYVKPLVFSHKRGSKLNALQASESQWLTFKQYIASLAVNRNGNVIAVTSPKGGVVGYWNRHTGTLRQLTMNSDCAGIAPLESEFIASTGHGLLTSTGVKVEHPLHWDNHMIAI